jgi:Fe-S oxidoreductase
MRESITRKEAENFAKNCIYGKKPACTCACPFNLDVPTLAGHLQEGNFTLAYKHYQNQAVFPGIVSRLCDEPCKNACVRKDMDEGISLNLLEKACVDFTETKEPRKFNLPPKNKKIAIIGAGLCGLTCAQKLGAKSYDVTVYEQSDRIGGRLWDLLEPDIFLTEIELQMKYARVTYKLNSKISSLDDIKFDAAFIATGKGGDDFSLLEGMNSESFGTVRPGVFIGGNILHTTPVEDIGQGITAAHSIEKYIKVGLMDGIPETFIIKESPLKIDLSRVKATEAVKPHEDIVYTKDEAVQEAQRCLKCNCTACSDCCEIFSHFNRWPIAVVGDAVASLHTKTSIKGQNSTRMMSSCNLCGLCVKVCPQDIDMGKFFHDFRYFKSEDKMYPPAFHDYFIRDMHFSNHDAYFAHTAPGYSKASHVFFPGCQLGASDPRYVEKTYDYLLKKMPDTAIIQGCCGAPADWAADKVLNEATVNKLKDEWEKMGKPAFIFACPTCKHQFEKFLPDTKGISLYSIIEEKGLPHDAMKAYAKACVFDPCSSRYDTSMQESVRRIAGKAGVDLSELFYSKDKAQCCGWGGHIQEANPALFNKIVNNRINAENLPYITYCTNCNDTFTHKGKECVHILDIVHGIDRTNYSTPSLSERRRNRLTAKKNILKKVWNIEMSGIDDFKTDLIVEIPKEITLKMNDMLILDEDVYKTIESCEASGYKLYDTERDLYIGHLRIGIITYWVEYRKEKEKFIVKNVYTHRVEIVENLK